MGIQITIKVVPGAKKARIALDSSGEIKWYITAQPEKGKANKELIQTFAKKLGIAASRITIIRGQTSRVKTLEIDNDITREELFAQLGLLDEKEQQSIV